MRIPARTRPDEFATPVDDSFVPSSVDISQHPSVEDVLGEVGLVLVVFLGIVLAINAVLIALHISP
jgi:hypothetical protein